MKLYKRASWFNPFHIEINNKCYELKNIHFFNRNGIICSTHRGWFGEGDNTLAGLTIDVLCVLKRKADFSLKTAFIVSTGEKNYDSSLSAVLYIPAEAVGLKEPVISKRTDRCFSIKWETQVDGLYCETYNYVDAHLSAIEHKISDVGEKISHLYGRGYDILPQHIEVLQKLYQERNEEKQRLANITDEEVLALYRQGA